MAGVIPGLLVVDQSQGLAEVIQRLAVASLVTTAKSDEGEALDVGVDVAEGLERLRRPGRPHGSLIESSEREQRSPGGLV
jgi:hypothetical protein